MTQASTEPSTESESEAPIEIVRGSGNVFADLGLPDPEERQTKLRLAMAINEILKARGLKQVEAGALLGV